MKNIPVRSIGPSARGTSINDGFRIRNVRDILGGKDMVQELHRHNFFYILVLQQGAGEHAIDFTRHKVDDRSIFLLRPGQVHQLTLHARSTGYLLEFDGGFYRPHNKVLQQSLRKVSYTNVHRPGEAAFKELLALLTSIASEYAEKQEGYREVVQSNLDIFFVVLARQREKAQPPPIDGYAQERLEALLTLLEKHIATRKQPSQYAEMLHLSLYQLNAITKAALGKTCSAVINEQIVLEAKRYLLATGNQVTQIANHLGYQDGSYFIRFFKKHTGYSPEAFRNNFK